MATRQGNEYDRLEEMHRQERAGRVGETLPQRTSRPIPWYRTGPVFWPVSLALALASCILVYYTFSVPEFSALPQGYDWLSRIFYFVAKMGPYIIFIGGIGGAISVRYVYVDEYPLFAYFCSFLFSNLGMVLAGIVASVLPFLVVIAIMVLIIYIVFAILLSM